MSIVFTDPRGVPITPPEPYTARIDLASFDADGLTIGLLANGFPDSAAFLRQVERALTEAHGARGRVVRTIFADKGNASAPAPEAMLAAMADEVHAVVTAYGH